MIIPSIDLMGGQAVQLVGGKEKALDAGDPRPIAERYAAEIEDLYSSDSHQSLN